jgi:sulfite dehydrogenase
MIDRLATRARRGAVAAVLAGLACGTASGADDDAALMALGKTLFTVGAVPPCALCHTLKDAGATGAIGPVFDDLQPGPDQVIAALKSGIGAMPSYRGSLSDEQMRALARYVSKASGGAR